MDFLHVLLLVINQVWLLTATEVLYVLPDDPTNVRCPSQTCSTLSQYLLDNNGLPVVSNVEYHFLPGEHHLPTTMTLKNLYNISFVGAKSSNAVVLKSCSSNFYFQVAIIHSQ